MPFARPSRWDALRGLQTMARTLGSERVRIERRGDPGYSTLGDVNTEVDDTETIYDGEVLVMPGTGQTDVQGLGQVETLSLQILVPGVHDIRQGDFVFWGSRIYQIETVGNIQGGGLPLSLRPFGQREVEP